MDAADGAGRDALQETIGYYLRGDAKEFHDYFMEDLNSGGMPPELAAKIIKALLHDRNKQMADAIVAALH